MKTRVTHSIKIPSELGLIRIDADENVVIASDIKGGIVAISFEGQKWEHPVAQGAATQMIDVLKLAVEQLSEYFAGHRQVFTLPLAASGTPFQEQVWHQIATIGCDQHLTYGAIAQRIDRPKASRAVGAATGRNPIGIVIPCHRVLGSNGALTGYAGGLDRKVWLLAHEQKMAVDSFALVS